MHMTLFALLLNAGGLFCLYLGWRDASAWARPAAFAGWVLLLLSGWAWSLAMGSEFGLSLLFLISGAGAWLLVIWHYARLEQAQGHRRAGKRSPVSAAGSAALSLPGLAVFARQLKRFLIAVPLAGVASALVVTAAVQFLPWQQGDRLVFTLYSVPLVWGAASWWACAAPRSWLPAAVFVLALFPSLMFLYG